MTLKELIATLFQYAPDTPVVVRGYEGGFNDISIVKPKTMQLNLNDKHYYGAHDCVKGFIVPDKPMTDVIYLEESIPTAINLSFRSDDGVLRSERYSTSQKPDRPFSSSDQLPRTTGAFLP